MKKKINAVVVAVIMALTVTLFFLLMNQFKKILAVQGILHSTEFFSRFTFGKDISNASDIRIEGGFDSANVEDVKQVGRNHFEIRMKPDIPSDYIYPDHTVYWFYFNLTGAKDKTVTIDITNCEWMPSHWDNYMPVYTYSTNPNDLEDHKWGKINDTERFGKVFRFTQTFTENTVYIALRYPYTYTYLTNYLTTIETNPYVFIDIIGKTEEKRNIYAIEVTDKTISNKNKKVVVILAKEHASEQECAWVSEGIIKYLLSDAPNAASLRANTIFVFFPVPAPDATYHGRTVNLSGLALPQRHSAHPAFRDRPAGMTVETKAIWEKIKKLTEDGKKIDIAANLHNPHGPEENVDVSYYSSPENIKNHERFNQIFFQYLDKYSKKNSKPPTSIIKFIFLGRMSLEYNALSFLYEINQHAKNSFLTINDLHEIGVAFANGVHDYFELSNIPDQL